jgi:transposase
MGEREADMSKVDRNNPKRSTASESMYTFYDFGAEFPDDAAVLDWLFRQRWPDGVFCPKCQRVTKHHREKARPSYSCQFCGHRVHPMKGTIFEDSATSLRLWFHGMYLMASTRCGISAKQLERELGVTYKTAWRMFNKIRSLLDQDSDGMFAGTVEMDGAFIGGRGYWRHGKSKKGAPGADDPYKTHVFGMAQRGANGEHGKVHAKVEPHPGKSLRRNVHSKVQPGSTVYTDEWRTYDLLNDLYTHGAVDHSKKVYVSGDVHVQTIEGFWSLVKRGISGVYHGVSATHLQAYLDEYVFRYNNRDATGRGVFDAFLGRLLSAAAPVS